MDYVLLSWVHRALRELLALLILAHKLTGGLQFGLTLLLSLLRGFPFFLLLEPLLTFSVHLVSLTPLLLKLAQYRIFIS